MPKIPVAFPFLAAFLAAGFLLPGSDCMAEGQPAAEPQAPTIEELIAGLKTKDDAALYETVHVLGERGPEAAPAVADLLRIFTSDKTSNNVRYETARTLGLIGPGAKDAVSALVQALRSSDATLRGYAADALGGIGPDAAAAASRPLAVALRDGNKAVRCNAARALGALKTDDGDALAALEDLRNSENDKVVKADFDAALRALKDAKEARQQATQQP